MVEGGEKASSTASGGSTRDALVDDEAFLDPPEFVVNPTTDADVDDEDVFSSRARFFVAAVVAIFDLEAAAAVFLPPFALDRFPPFFFFLLPNPSSSSASSSSSS